MSDRDAKDMAGRIVMPKYTIGTKVNITRTPQADAERTCTGRAGVIAYVDRWVDPATYHVLLSDVHGRAYMIENIPEADLKIAAWD